MFKKNQLVRVDNAGRARKILSIRPACQTADDLHSLAVKEGDAIALLSGSGMKVFSITRLSAVE